MEDLNENIIANKPWAKNMLHDAINITKKAVLDWCHVVTELGENEVNVEEWIIIFHEQSAGLYKELLLDINNLKDKVINNIEDLLQKSHKLSTDLRITDAPVTNFEEMGLYEVQKKLMKKVEEFETIYGIRLKELNDLKEKQLDLCQSLGKEPKLMSDSPLPTATELEELKDYIEKLEAKKFDRIEKSIKLKSEIIRIADQLNIQPSLDFEKQLLALNESVIVNVSDQYMIQLETYYENLFKKFNQVKEEITELRKAIDDLWNQLDVSMIERDLIRKSCEDISLQTLDILKEEKERCKNLKKANLKKFIDKERQELITLWDKCYASGEDKASFQFLYSDCYSEDLLEIHEMEIDKWKNYYDNNKELILLIDEYKNTWAKLIELEEKSNGPNRYQNRGGQLLKEEKERNLITKRMPIIEKNLTTLAENYLKRNRTTFYIQNLSIDEYIKQQHRKFEDDKKLKLSAKKQKRELQKTPTKSRIALFPLTTSQITSRLTPQTVLKRKCITPMEKSTNRKCLTNTSKKPIPASTSKLSAAKRRISKERLERRRRFSLKLLADKNQSYNSTVSYENFEKEVSDYKTAKSSLLPENILVKTPVKVSNQALPSTSAKTLKSTPMRLIQEIKENLEDYF